ncbi:MAG: protein translocase subunit SecF [Candidatus Paceibacterota bacterium]|jgi:preprotein translocase subunit SecF
MIDLIRRKYLFLSVSGVLVAAAIFSILVFGFREGVDFKGGTLWQIKINDQSVTTEDVTAIIQPEISKIGEAKINRDISSDSFLARLPVLNETEHQKLIEILKAKFPKAEELSFQSIGPSVGAALRKNAFISIALVLIGISLYIAYSFRKVSRPISSWKYGFVTLISLFHDIAIPAGLLAILGHFGTVEIDGNFVVALLVIMGFSVHDTIVVFDRIRENLYNDKGKSDFGQVINTSVNQTIARSINTSLTLVLVLLALFFAGPINLKYFILTLLIGVVMGTYSSIFVASPALYIWQKLSKKGK